MLWLADVLIGTKSQQWSERYGAGEVVGAGSKRTKVKRISGAVRSAWEYLHDWFQRRRDIHTLSQLNDHLLNDIGIERAEIAEYVRNNGQVRVAKSTATTVASVEETNSYVLVKPRPIAQQCVVRSGVMSCANDSEKRVA